MPSLNSNIVNSFAEFYDLTVKYPLACSQHADVYLLDSG